jgi:sigma-B regulation protein RsbU (phosphoserine phosphatase)
LQDQLLGLLRDQLVTIVSGTIFLFVGLAALCLAAIRRQSQVRLFLWLGIWSGMYGAGLLIESPAVAAALPHWIQISIPFLRTSFAYLLVPVVALAWLELSIDKMRPFLHAVILLSLAIGIAGIGFFLVTGSKDRLMLYSSLVAAVALVVLVVVVAVPSLARRFFVLPNRSVMVVGTLVFAIEALHFNLSRAFHYPIWRVSGSLGLAVFLFSFGYSAVQIALQGERRLLSIESELAIAREIQTSILPSENPDLKGLCVVTAYRPMTDVAGDFYEFIPVDPNRTGFLVADVTGHGIPAALIAAMIKVAMQSVATFAHNPQEVLQGLNRVLFPQLHAQLVSAAYLWLDTENHIALYSAAGHPPLLHCRDGKVERIESNGLLLGVLPDSDYPLYDLTIFPGDRFLLYTDGVTEAENALGQAFGDHKFEEVVQRNRSLAPSELSDKLLAEIRQWQPPSVTQRDDITLIVIDAI